MREPNHAFPFQNRAAVCITPQLYDRRALDGPVSTLPLISSLNHLAYLTSTSPRIREILTLDGGLERLVAIVLSCLKAAAKTANQDPNAPLQRSSVSQGGPFRSFASYSKKTPLQLAASTGSLPAINKLTPRSEIAGSTAHARALLITYTLSLQSLVNVGVRGSESVRTRVVEAGVLTVAAAVLRGYLEEREKLLAQAAFEYRKTSKSARRESSTPAPLRVRISEPALPAISAPASPTQANVFSQQTAVPPLSAQSSQAPTRVNTPDAMSMLQGSSANATFLVPEEGTGNSSEDGEMDQEREEELPDLPQQVSLPSEAVPVAQPDDSDLEGAASTALATRGRQRSATLKSMPNPDEDEPMENASEARRDDMDVEMADASTEVPAVDLPLSPTPTSRSREPRRPRLSIEQASPISEVPFWSTANYDGFRFRDEDVLLCLQLLAFLSKYPHVRAVFHDPQSDFTCSSNLTAPDPPPTPADKSQNVFSLVEKYTVSPSDHRCVLAPFARTDLQKKMLSEIHYWAGVIMRNACRKDEARGGIRQCANMLCGRWETCPREFAKCRRCRKAKYCSKECQKKAWHGGHRFWCSVRENEIRPEASEADTVAIQRFIEQHPELANNPDALNELARRLRHYHRSRLDGNGEQRRRPRNRANTLPTGAVNPLSPAEAPNFILRPTFNEDEDAEEEQPDDQVADNAVEIAGDGPEGLMRMSDVQGIRLDGA